jgi:hypothetical protein
MAPFATGIEKPAEAQALKAGCVALVDDRKKDLIPAGAEDVPEQAFEKHAPREFWRKHKSRQPLSAIRDPLPSRL